MPAGFLFNGALATYEKLDFTRSRQIGKHRWVVTRVVEPAPIVRDAATAVGVPGRTS